MRPPKLAKWICEFVINSNFIVRPASLLVRSGKSNDTAGETGTGVSGLLALLLLVANATACNIGKLKINKNKQKISKFTELPTNVFLFVKFIFYWRKTHKINFHKFDQINLIFWLKYRPLCCKFRFFGSHFIMKLAKKFFIQNTDAHIKFLKFLKLTFNIFIK